MKTVLPVCSGNLVNLQQSLLIIQQEKGVVIHHCATQFGYYMTTYLQCLTFS